MRRVAVLLTVGLLGAATAWAANPSPPHATTGSAGNVSTSSATVTGTIDSGNAATGYSFHYGTSTAYGLTTPTQTTPAATTPATVTATITNLTPHTAYHYRLSASNAAGNDDGDDKTLTTAFQAKKPAASTGNATLIGPAGATLNASVTPNALATTYVFQYGTTTSYGNATPSTDVGNGTAAVAVNKAIGGLKASTTYHYRVVATNSMGATNGSDHSFKTQAVAAKPGVSTGDASKVTSSSATLNGKVDPNGVTTTYVFQYGTGTSYGSLTAAKSAGKGGSAVNVSAGIGGLKVHTTYHFRLVATSANGVTQGGDHSFYTASGALGATIQLRPDPVVFGHGIAIVGTINGAGSGIPVVLHSQVFPFTAPAATLGNPQLTSGNGGYRFVVPAASIRTRYFVTATVAGKALTSKTAVSRVRVRVGLLIRRIGGHRVRFSGTVRPAFLNTTVSIQRRSKNLRLWLPVAHATVLPPLSPGGAQRFAKQMSLLRGGVFRAVALPKDGGAHTRNVSTLRAIHIGR